MGGIAKLAAKGAKNLFDLSDLRSVPDVPQFPLDRYDPPRGMPKGLASIVTPKNARRLEEIARRGMDLGGPEWYNLEPLRLKFVAEMGEAEGNRLFRRYVDYVAATSPRSKVDANIRRGSYFYGREMQGLPVAELKNPELPKGYGHLAHETQNALLRDLEGGGTFGALNRPKTTSFAENLAGNQRPMTIDTHNMALVVGPKRSPSQTEYRYLEDFQAEIADKLGLTPAQFQASLWVAGDTGVANPRPFMEIFDQVVERTAVKDKKSKEQALKDFITGEAPLFGLGTVMSGLVLQDGVPKAEGMAVGGAVSSAAKAIRRLVEAGFPESTAEKIVMGELPMDPASVNRRRFAQGKTMPAIHTGDARAAKAPFFDPDINAAAGTFSTDNPYLANTYYNPGGSADRMAMYPLFLDDSDYALVNANIGSDWMEMSGDIMTPDASDIIESFSDLNTNEVARRVRELGYPGVRMEGVQDVGPAGADAAYDAAYQIGLKEGGGDPDYAEEFARGIVTDVERNLGEGQGMIFSSFDPKTVRSRFAAFDPDQVDSPNLMASLGPAAIGAGLFGAAMAPEEAEAAGFGTLARAIGRPTQRLFQGSSAKFARPSMQSVGTGTGNQAFGYGLYFTEAPDIAGTYKRGLANKKMIQGIEDQGLVPGVSAGELDDMIDDGVFGEAETRFLSALRDADYLGFDNVHNAAMVALKRGDLAKRYDAVNDPAVAELDKIANELGFLYEVEVPGESFIEWDLPLDQQPEVVQQVVKQNAPPEFKDRIESGQFKGLEAYYLFGKNPEVNSMMWAQYGVPGIRYSSVRTKEGKVSPDAPRNYVIFDENLINIVRRNDEALENNFDELAARASATDIRKPLAATLAAGAAGTTQAEDLAPGEYDAIASERLGQELDRLMQLAEIRRQPSIVPLDDTAMARVGDYLLEDRPSEMDTLQRALQRLDMAQGLGDYFQTTGQGDPTTIMQDLLAGLDIFDVLGLLPGAGKASSAAVRAAQ